MDMFNTTIGKLVNAVLVNEISHLEAKKVVRSWQGINFITTTGKNLNYNSRLGVGDLNKLVKLGKLLKDSQITFSFHGVSVIVSLENKDKSFLNNFRTLVSIGFRDLKESTSNFTKLQYDLVKKWQGNSYTIEQKRFFFPNS